MLHPEFFKVVYAIHSMFILPVLSCFRFTESINYLSQSSINGYSEHSLISLKICAKELIDLPLLNIKYNAIFATVL